MALQQQLSKSKGHSPQDTDNGEKIKRGYLKMEEDKNSYME